MTRLDGLEQIAVTYPIAVGGGFTVAPGDGTGAHFGLALNVFDPMPCTVGYEGTTIRPGNDTARGAEHTGVLRARARECHPVRGSQNAPTAEPRHTGRQRDDAAGPGADLPARRRDAVADVSLGQLLGLPRRGSSADLHRQMILGCRPPWLAVLTAGYAAYFGVAWWSAASHSSASSYARSATRCCGSGQVGITNFTTLDYKKVDEDLERWLDSSTGELRAEIDTDKDTRKKQLEDAKTVTASRRCWTPRSPSWTTAPARRT